MKTSTSQVLCKVVLFSTLTFVVSGCAAQDTTPEDTTPEGMTYEMVTTLDCAKIDLQYLDSELLTREEKIALLDQTLLRAVNNIESCPTISDTNNQAVGGGGVQGTENATREGIQETENRVGKAVVESMPASNIQGDAPLPENDYDNQIIADHETTTRESEPYRKATEPNGKLPEDIPEAKSDDIIAQQFRQAAIEETDPEIKAKLWNEYRRYKGLPVQEYGDTET